MMGPMVVPRTGYRPTVTRKGKGGGEEWLTNGIVDDNDTLANDVGRDGSKLLEHTKLAHSAIRIQARQPSR